MVITDHSRGIEYHLNLDNDGKIKSVEIVFAEPRDLSCMIRPEGLFAPCTRRPPYPVTPPVGR